MPNWILKATIQGALSVLPCANEINTFLQRHVTKRLALTPQRFETKVSQCRRHLEYAFDIWGGQRTSLAVLELGTGWHPVIPVGLYLCGASVVWTIDIESLLLPASPVAVARLFAEYAASGRLSEILPWAREDRIANMKKALEEHAPDCTGADFLKALDVKAQVADARDTGMPRASVDLFVSNCVLEHIPRDVIVQILREFKRVAAPGAIMSHLVDMSDHYADSDHSITPLNFLKYSDRRWRWFNNSLHYQNRLRIQDYRQIHNEAGFTILREYNVQEASSVLDSVRLATRFRGYSRQDLLVTRGWFISSGTG